MVSLSPCMVSLSNHGQVNSNPLILKKIPSNSTGSLRQAQGERQKPRGKDRATRQRGITPQQECRSRGKPENRSRICPKRAGN